MTVQDLPHNQLLNQAGLKFKELSEDIKTAASALDKSFKGYAMKKNPETLKNIQAQSRVLAQQIFDYFVEDGEATTIAGMANQIKEEKNDGNSNTPSNNPPNLGDSNGSTQPVPAKVQKKVNPNETALKKIFDEGKTSGITKKDLAEAGFDVGMWSTPIERHGCVIGSYALLVENRAARTFTLTKK